MGVQSVIFTIVINLLLFSELPSLKSGGGRKHLLVLYWVNRNNLRSIKLPI